MRKVTKRMLAGAAVLGLAAVPAAASATDDKPNIVDVVISTSGPEGFDDNAFDYDLLREALVATDLVGAVQAAEDVTVFAPRDQAFKRLARDLGYTGHDEAGVFAFLAGATGYVSPTEPGLLDDILLYHVAPGAKTAQQLKGKRVETLLGQSVKVRGTAIIDADRDDRNARITPPKNIMASNGIVHTVNEVLRPADLDAPPAPAPFENVVDVVLETSGTEGFDDNMKDYDLLREALTAAGLVGAVQAAEDITVFAPRDGAFVKLARDLGFAGHDEAGAFAFIAGATGYVSPADPGLLDDVLLYHVVPGAKTAQQLKGKRVETLLGQSVKVVGNAIIDADRDDRNARITPPKNIMAGNGIVHTVNEVLRPINL